MSLLRAPPPAWLAWATAALVGCADLPTERAQRDQTVGRALADGVAIAAVDGLAVVRALGPGELLVRASAPTVELGLDVSNAGRREWTLELRNVLGDATLEGQGPDGEPVTCVALDELRPTVRRYRVVLPGPGHAHLRIASPDADAPTPLRIALLGDVQTGIDRLDGLLARIEAEPDVRFVLAMGDLTSNGKNDEMDRVEEVLGGFALPVFSTIGNHDAPANTPWHEHFGRASQRFAFHGVQFTLLDSAGATVAPLARQWLDDWLAEGRDRVHVFVTHVPPLDPAGLRPGSFASRDEAAELLGALARARVDLTLYGHIHSYYSFENAGIQAIITGGGGARDEGLDGIGRHYLVVDLDPAGRVGPIRFVPVEE